MKKIVLFTTVLFVYSSIFSQKNTTCGKLYYNLKVDIGFGIIEKTDYLMTFDNNIAFSNEIIVAKSQNNFDKSKTKKPTSNIKRTIIIPERVNLTPRFFYNSIDEFYYSIIMDNESIIVKDDKNDWKWKIQTDTKIIEGYTCKKATIDFRGKSYVVWFTDKIAVPFGPWKLQKLPGLILEIQSTDKSLQVKTSKIVINQNENCKIDFDKTQLKKALTTSELIEKRNEIIKALDEKEKYKFPTNPNELKNYEECKECPKGIEKYDKKK